MVIKTSADLFKALTGKDPSKIKGSEGVRRLTGSSGSSGMSISKTEIRKAQERRRREAQIKAEAEARKQKEAELKRQKEEARKKGISLTIQKQKDRLKKINAIKKLAKKRGVNISTRVRQIGFFNQLRQESKTPVLGSFRPVQDNGRPISTLTAAEQPTTFFLKLQKRFDNQRRKLRTKLLRGKN